MKCHGGKHSKQRVTLMLLANMDGSEKAKLLLIGKSKQPRCFRNVKWLPLDYKANADAWMTGALFEEWLLKLDKQFKNQGRKIIVFIDNCPAHPKDIQKKLKCIKLTFFPPNMTSKLQPLDQGIIQCLKCHYRRRILKKSIKRFEENKNNNITLIDCVDDVTTAWDIDVKPETISNCFKKAGFGQYSEWEEEDEIPLIFLSERLKEKSEDEIQLEIEFKGWTNIRGIAEGSTINDFIRVDEDIVTSEFLTDEDIIESCRSEPVQLNIEDDCESDTMEEEFEDDFQQPPSNKLVENSLSV
ncbi:tigger transposable element-derived protein 4-like [Sitophilus oryzae]|uniref:Tigger transposable element-derived protein 4-like n=1 Tax=Sitophilus oryzae TaxID=7048 RepID=A0A6J2XEQ4_SITOR|nr:tigger transposable element-derived protein 4-like [Sitophilus oryzae]